MSFVLNGCVVCVYMYVNSSLVMFVRLLFRNMKKLVLYVFWMLMKVVVFIVMSIVIMLNCGCGSSVLIRMNGFVNISMSIVKLCMCGSMMNRYRFVNMMFVVVDRKNLNISGVGLLSVVKKLYDMVMSVMVVVLLC